MSLTAHRGVIIGASVASGLIDAKVDAAESTSFTISAGTRASGDLLHFLELSASTGDNPSISGWTQQFRSAGSNFVGMVYRRDASGTSPDSPTASSAGGAKGGLWVAQRFGLPTVTYASGAFTNFFGSIDVPSVTSPGAGYDVILAVGYLASVVDLTITGGGWTRDSHLAATGSGVAARGAVWSRPVTAGATGTTTINASNPCSIVAQRFTVTT